jgi:hypothetical protein
MILLEFAINKLLQCGGREVAELLDLRVRSLIPRRSVFAHYRIK